ncbi:MAG: cadherin-like domain-containing protein, partial [Halieaceae bacterium]|nr:cadherin-like domain-containing protein [Halieaceae bacterium]
MNWKKRYRRLEDRVLLDAAGAVTVVDTTDNADTADAQADSRAEHQQEQDELTSLVAALGESQEQAEQAEPADSGPEILFVDSQVEDIDQLLQNLDDNIEVFFIDPDEDGAAYIADVLENSDKTYSAIHIVSHGGSGELRLGNTTLTTDSLEGETLGHVQAWGDNLTEDGDILIYGCSVAEGEDGLAFVEQLADVTGADIAASVDDTGAAALGGDWDLEVSAGDVETDLAIAEPAQVSWGHVLDLTVQDRAALGGGAAADQAIADGLSPDGSGVNISSITYLGGDESIGLFTDLSAGPTGNLLSEGVVISTGFANNLIGDGTAGNTISDNATGPGGAGEADDDADLNTSSINAGIDFDQYDIATFEFSFTPAPGVTKLALNYVFATEETQAFANGQYPDVFGIYVRNAEVGQSYQEFVFTNLRVLHATAPAAGGLFDNSATDTTGNVESNFVTGVQSALLDITTLPGSDSEYTVKFAVADHSDTQLDSAGFFDWLGSSVRLDIDGDDSSGATGLDYDTDFDISTGTEVAVVDVGDVTLINYDSTTTLQTATVRLTNATGSDTLAIDTTGLANIDSTSIDTSVPGEITLTIDFDDTATTEADVIAALAAVTYDNTDGLAIDPADRSIEIVVNDGVTDSSDATATVAITGFMDVPTVTGQVTTSLQPTITGSFDEADSDTLVVVVDGTTYTWSNLRGGGTPPTGLSSDGSGNWTLDLAAAGQTLSSDGAFDVEVTTSNDAGSISDASTDELVVDATGPADPTVTALATSQSNPTITGTYDDTDGTVTQVVVNGITYLATGPDLTVNANGTWSLTIPGGDDLSPGTYDVQVTAEDPVGNPTVVTSVGALEVLAPGAIAAANDVNTVGEDGPTLVVPADGVLANDLFIVPDPSRPPIETSGASTSELYLNFDASQDTDNDGDWDDEQANGVANLDRTWEWGTNLAPIAVSSQAAPSITHAFDFDGTVAADISGGLDGSLSENSATFEFWLKVDSGLTTGTNYTIFESGDGADGFTLAYRPTATGNGEFVVYYNDDDLNSGASTGTSVLSLGTAAGFDPTADFMQVVLSFDEPSNAILWHINGQTAAGAGLTVTTSITDLDDWGATGAGDEGLGGVGNAQGGSTGTGIGTVANFEGQMAIMRLYGYESGGAARPEPLTDAQILTNYNAVAQSLTASVSAVNGAAGNVGNPVTTVNGGIFTINSDGSYSYDPNGAFESLAPGDTASDSVTYTIDNGLSTDTATLEITITGANDAPTLTGDLTAAVDEGAAYVLTGSDLGYTDVDDNDAGITFTVSNLVNGTVQVGGSPVTSFTATHLNAGQVSFVHDGSETLAAGFDVNVDDGNEDGSTPTDSTFNFTVNPVNDPPVLAVNNGLNVVNAGTGTITVVLLETTDADDSAADITYTVTSLPANGTLLINGAAAAVNDTFTQAQVNAGQVTYTHDGTPTTTDSFGFDVDDGDEDGSGAISDTFAISIVVDGVAPLAPTIDLLASSDTGSSSSDDFTSDNTPTFRVTFDQTGPVNQDVAAGDTVQLYIDGTPFGAPFAVSPADVSNGFIDITTIALPDGTANYSVTITDQVGNESPASAALPVQIKTDGPAIPTVNSQATANTTPTITGSFDDVNTDTLEVTFDGVTYTPSDPELTVSGSTWSLAVPAPLADGTYEVSVTTTDEFGIASTDTSSGELVINTSDNLVLSDDTLTVDEASTGSGNLLTNDIITTADPTPPPGEETLDTTDLVSSFDAATDTDGDSVWEDTGSAGLDLTLGSGVTRDTSPTTSLTSITAAYDFDGTANSTAISSGFPSEVLTEEPTAFEFWLKIDPSVVAGEEYIIIESGDATSGFSLVYEAAADPADGKFIVYFDDQDNGVVATAEIDLGGAIDPTAEFTHLVVRIVDDNAASYIDFFVNGGTGLGGLQASTAVNNLDDWGREDQSIAVGTVSGAQGGSSQSSVTPNNFIGQIASIRIYDETTAGGATIPVSQIENNYLATINADPYVSAITGTSTQTLADPDNGPATSATVTGTGGGQFTVFSDGSYSYDPNGQFESLAPGDTATDTISYTVTAPDGQTETATLTVTVTGLNDPPTLDTNSTLNLDEGATATITNAFLSASDIDDPASGITYVVDSLPGNGSLLINGVLATVGATFTQDDVDSGLITYVHDDSDTTADSFNFSVDDGDEDGSGATSATFNFSINAVDDTAPTVVADSATLAEGASTTIDLAANDSDSESGLDL